MATARPEEAVAVGRVGGAADHGPVGAVEVKVMVWEPLPTVKVCWTWGRPCSWRCRPGWRRPCRCRRSGKLTTPAVIEHTDDDEASMVMVHRRPEDRPVAVGV
jgi:hypothetical protein